MKKISVLFSLFSVLLLNSCSSIETEVDLLPIDNLTAGNFKVWKLSYYKENGVDKLADCLKDDTFIFIKKDSKYEWKKGNIKCIDNDVDISFDFKLSADSKTLNISGIDYIVNNLDNKTFEIERQMGSTKQILGYSILEL